MKQEKMLQTTNQNMNYPSDSFSHSSLAAMAAIPLINEGLNGKVVGKNGAYFHGYVKSSKGIYILSMIKEMPSGKLI